MTLSLLVSVDDTPRVLFAKPLTNSDTCFSVSKGGRITLPRLAVETNLPAVANKRHNEVVRGSPVTVSYAVGLAALCNS
jgi:hypothetical protein